MHKKIDDIQLAGFAVSVATPGEKVTLSVKDCVTSDSDLFHVYAERLADVIFSKIGVQGLRNWVNCYMVVIHPDARADVFLEDFKVISTIKINRSIKAGEVVYARDVEDIVEVRFPDIQINPNDGIIYLQRIGWKFGIYFDFTRKVDVDKMAVDIAEFHKLLIFQNTLEDILAKLQTETDNYDAFIITEGKTDWKHLEKAFEKIGYRRRLEFFKLDEDLGDMELLETVRRIKRLPNKKAIICIFDRDNPKIVEELSKQTGGADTEYQDWGNNVFSMMLPVPDHRKDYQNISIEMYYPDEIIKRESNDGKRLFFDNELKMEKLPGGKAKRIPISPIAGVEFTKKIYSTDVDSIEDSSGQKRGISKTVFAALIYKAEAPFHDVDFGNFRLISEIIEKILNDGPAIRMG
jgi:hypothetical protein